MQVPDDGEDLDELDMELLNLATLDQHVVDFCMSGKRRNRPSKDEGISGPQVVRRRAGLEKASEPQDRSTRLADEDMEEENMTQDLPRMSGSPRLWRASVNAIESPTDLMKPSTFEEAITGTDQVHWRKAIRASALDADLRSISCC